jgi:hypothetical protein
VTERSSLKSRQSPPLQDGGFRPAVRLRDEAAGRWIRDADDLAALLSAPPTASPRGRRRVLTNVRMRNGRV